MNVLVTGAGGVIAASVVTQLLADGHRVVALDSRPEGLEPLAALGAETAAMQLPSVELARLVDSVKPDLVVHAAAIVDVTALQRQPHLGFRVNAEAAVDLLAAAAAAQVHRFVFLSSRAVYGLADGGAASTPPVAESEPLRPVSVYDVCKAAVEGMGANYAATTDMQFTAMRFATIMGPGKTERHTNASLFSTLVEQSWSGRPVQVNGNRDESYDLVYLDDAAAAVYQACIAPEAPAVAYNVGSGRITTLGEVIDAVQMVIPDAAITVTGQGQALPMRYRYPLDITRATADLDYRPVGSVVEYVRRYVAVLDSRRRSVAR